MKEFRGKVAVVSGGASGIGRAMAERFAEEGMKIVISDIEESALAKAKTEMESDGADVLAIPADVSNYESVENLADKSFEAYGGVHILCNNAGVGFGGPSWEISIKDWEWVLGVNLWGVIYGAKAFIPRMIELGEDGHIINTSSMAGVTTGVGMAPYNVSKHGVVTLSETMAHELASRSPKLKVSVLCPGWVDTKINESDRNRPEGRVTGQDAEQSEQFRAHIAKVLKKGLSTSDVADLVMESIIDERFYIFPHPHWKNMIQARLESMMHDRLPALVPPPEV